MGTTFLFILLVFLHVNLILVLHPKHKLQYFEQAGWEASWVKRAEELVRTEFERLYKYRDNDFLAPTNPMVR